MARTALPVFLVIALVAWSGLVSGGRKSPDRFPPLQVPAGFQATLFACDPLIEYPSVIAAGPRPGSLFVAFDYMTGLGHEIIRRDEIHLVEDSNGDGYADQATKFAEGFNSIQGLAYHNGTVYVMHAPYLSAVTLTLTSAPGGKGEAKGGERRDLLRGLGLLPEKDQIRLHNANGVVPGHDGWLYLAMGDRGVNVVRPEGDTLVLQGGGILRCRPDGRDLHVFATGLRNIYDVALDDDLNVFVRDNENDGGAYKNRLYHSFFGADHGYPYLYDERPAEALPPLADLGLGSSAGGAAYLERQFPVEFRGNLFFCEWGKSVMRSRPAVKGSSFAPLQETVFASGASNDPYGFKPTDIVVHQDGSLFVSDWADGQRPKRGRGRIYQIRSRDAAGKPAVNIGANTTDAELLQYLDSDSYTERCRAQHLLERRAVQGMNAVEDALKNKKLGLHGRRHAVWIIAQIDGAGAIDRLLSLAQTDDDPRVQVQAIRAIADLADPVLRHRAVTDAGNARLAARLAAHSNGRDPRVLRETAIALGRLRWAGSAAWFAKHITTPDPALAHAIQATLRRSENWPALLQFLDLSSADPFRAIVQRAVADQFDASLVDGLIERLQRETAPTRQRDYADLLTRVWKKPGTTEYWGFRPKPRPANTVVWERTAAIEQALERTLGSIERTMRPELVTRMLREQIPIKTASLENWLMTETDARSVAVILTAIGERPSSESRQILDSVLRNSKHAVDNRRTAVKYFTRDLDAESEQLLLAAATSVEDGPVLADLLRALGKRKRNATSPLLVAKTKSASAEVRAAALDALADLQLPETGAVVLGLLEDKEAMVRSAAAAAAGKLSLHRAADILLVLARDADAAVRRSSLAALRQLREPRALKFAVAALDDPETALAAIAYIGELGGPEQNGVVVDLARRQPSVENLTAIGKTLAGWSNRTDLAADQRLALRSALAEIHGNGQILAWHVAGPLPLEKAATAREIDIVLERESRLALTTGIDARLDLGTSPTNESVWLARSEVHVPENVSVEFFTASNGLETIWLNDRIVFERDRPGIIGPYPDRFEGTLTKGANRLLVRLARAADKAQMQIRFRRKSATPEQERFTLAALSRAGNPAHGREIFLNAQKSQCIKCHRVGDQGERTGPDLTGLGSRFPKVYIVESVLQPSRTIAPSYETIALVMKNGTVLTGVKTAETATTFTLVDNQTKKHEIARSDVEEQQRHPLSTMPDGLERTLSEDEFVDLISFLVNLKRVE